MTIVFIKAQHVTQAILLDQFGVLHDGQKPYPGAIEAVTALADSGRSVLIISNSSRRMHPHNGSCGLSDRGFSCVFTHRAMSRGGVLLTGLMSWQLDE